MAQATSVSLKKFTSAVQAAVKAATQKHTHFKIDPPHGITIAYLIRGFPVPEPLLAGVTLAQTQAFAADVAAHLGSAVPEALAPAAGGHGPAQGAVLSVGGHVIIGVPPLPQAVLLEQ